MSYRSGRRGRIDLRRALSGDHETRVGVERESKAERIGGEKAAGIGKKEEEGDREWGGSAAVRGVWSLRGLVM